MQTRALLIREVSAVSSTSIAFQTYQTGDYDGCLALFDRNCPDYFAPNEREDYIGFLRSSPQGYQVARLNERVVAAFGLTVEGSAGRISWIMVCPDSKGQGVGAAMMRRAKAAAAEARVESVDIAASHLSAPFFAHFGADAVETIPDGWGAGMHRVDMRLRISQ